MNKCCVVDQFCESPYNVADEGCVNLRGVCFSCGEYVCTKCSSKRTYYNYGRVRLCNNCQVEYDGNDSIVMRRLRKLAEY